MSLSPEAKRVMRRPRRWRPVDVQDVVIALVCTHVLVLFLGYAWGHWGRS